MSETPSSTAPETTIESITPSPVGRALIVGLIGVGLGVFLGYTVAKILAEDRMGRYEPGRLEYEDIPDDGTMDFTTEPVLEEEPEADLTPSWPEEVLEETPEPADPSEL